MLFVIDKDTTGGVNSAVNATLVTEISQVESSDNVSPHSGWLVIFTPINVRAPSDSGSVQNVGRFDLIKLLRNRFAVLQPTVADENFNAL